jgi:hypothetical protein
LSNDINLRIVNGHFSQGNSKFFRWRQNLIDKEVMQKGKQQPFKDKGKVNSRAELLTEYFLPCRKSVLTKKEEG